MITQHNKIRQSGQVTTGLAQGRDRLDRLPMQFFCQSLSGRQAKERDICRFVRRRILACRFTQNRRISRDVKHIIHNLKSQPHCLGIQSQGLLLRETRPRRQAAKRHTG